MAFAVWFLGALWTVENQRASFFVAFERAESHLPRPSFSSQ